MEIIGGAAALLAYGAHSATKDIDSLANIDERIQQAARRTTRTISPRPRGHRRPALQL